MRSKYVTLSAVSLDILSVSYNLKVVLEQGYVPHDLLNEESCEEDGDYHESKFIDCYCKPEDHIAWVASLAILGTLFLAIKFAIHFVNIYRTKKKREKEEALVSFQPILSDKL